MKKLITSALFLFCVSAVVAQTAATDDYYNGPDSGVKPKLTAKDRVSASISAGAGVSVFNGNTAFTTFVAPKIGYQLTQKFKLNIGLLHYTTTGSTFMPLNYNEGIYNPTNHSISGNVLFVEGQYQLNKRLMMSGAVMYDANGLNASNNQNNYKAASLGLEYKVSDHASIGIKATVSGGQGQGGYYNNPNPFPAAGGFNNTFGTGFSNESSMFMR